MLVGTIGMCSSSGRAVTSEERKTCSGCAYNREGVDVSEADVDKVTKCLAGTLERRRREAIAYAILTVLCTPVFVVIAGLTVAALVAVLLQRSASGVESDAMAFYTAANGFLGYMIVFVLTRSQESRGLFEFHSAWIAATSIFIGLILATYLTAQPEMRPVAFGVLYACGGLLILGLLGQVPLPLCDSPNCVERDGFFSCVLAVSEFIVSAYGDIFSSSWLWRPPEAGRIQLAGLFLLRAAEDGRDPPREDLVDGRTLDLLCRLKLVEIEEHEVRLTFRGQEFLREAACRMKDESPMTQ